MTISNSRLAYTDCFDAFDKALEDPMGIRIPQPDFNAATFLRMRFHNARKIDRKDNTNTYEPGDPLYGRSVYDRLVLRIKQSGGAVYLYMEHIPDLEGIESLSKLEDGEGEGDTFQLTQPESPEEPLPTEPIRRRV